MEGGKIVSSFGSLLRSDIDVEMLDYDNAVPFGITRDIDNQQRFADDPNTDDGGLGSAPIVDMGAYERKKPNASPTANTDEYTAHKNIMLGIGPAGVLENDIDPDDDPMTAVLETDVSSGTLLLDSDGSFDYTPQTDFVGPVTFAYKACDSQDCSDAATVTVDVVNDAPVAEADSYEMFSTNTLIVDAEDGLLANDTDSNDDELTVELVENVPAGAGALSLNSDGSLAFNPNSEHLGGVTFTYKAIDDSQAESDPATVTIDLIKLTAGAEPVHIDLSSTDTINLDGTIEGSEGDGVEGVDSVQWYVTALTATSGADVGIGGYTKENPDTTATFSEQGRYSIYLEATKGGISGSSNKMDILVESTINKAPKAQAGDNQVITWPDNTVNLYGDYTDDGLLYGEVKPTWTMLSSTGGGSAEFGDPNAWDTTATFTRPDTYVLQLEADDYAKSGYDTCRVLVEERFPPDANAGADTSIPFPPGAESVSYTFEKDGTGANGVYVRDHTGADYAGQCTIIWEPVAGQTSEMSFVHAEPPGTTVTFTAPGQYVLRLYAEANDTGLDDDDFVAIDVTGEYPLEVYAGADQDIFLPGIAQLAGEVLKGEPDTTRWSLIEGAGLVTFEDPNSLITEVKFNWPGTYVFKLKAESEWGPATDEVEITVRTMMVAGGQCHTLFLDEHGILWACGNNCAQFTGSPSYCLKTGSLGVGSEKDKINYPMRVVGPEGEGFLENIICMDAGSDFSLAVDKDGYVWSWGVNNYGVLGVDTEPSELPDSPIPVQVAGEGGVGYLADIVKVAAGGNTVLALGKNGRVWVWGSNYNAKLGKGSYSPEYEASPIQVMNESGLSPLADIIDIDVGGSCLALDKQGRVWSWGYNLFGALEGEPNDLRPVCILAPKEPNAIVDVTAGIRSGYALTKAGEVWSWGFNGEGQGGCQCDEGGCLGGKLRKVVSGGQDKDEPNGGYCSDTLLKDIIAISGGGEHAVALEKNGRVWLWGYWGVDISDYFCSGWDVCHGHMYTPVEITNRVDSYNMTGATYIYASQAGAYAIDSDGWFWTCGCNNYGQLGLGFTCGYPICSAYNRGYPMDVPLPQPLSLGKVFNVTQDKRYTRIQRALDGADDGDEIVVYEGYFCGDVSFPIDERDIILRSSDPYDPDVVANTIIDGMSRPSPIREKDSVTITGNSVIEGFTITGGSDGIVCVEGSSPVIRNNIVRDNGENGIYCGRYSTPFIENNIIVNNGSSIAEEGDGINLNCRSTPQIRNNTIVRNYRYGIIRNDDHQGCHPEIINCVIWSHWHSEPSGYPDDSNCLIYNCPDPNYCCIENLPSGVGIGNISSDPCFVDTDPNVNDYHLRSVSPCINAGDPCYISTSTDYEGQPRIMGCQVDIGADEYAHLQVRAGGYKHTTLTSPDVKLSDASVLYNGLPQVPGAVTVVWSRIKGPTNGVTFDDAYKVKAIATFCMAGTYILKLTAYEDGCIAGEDIVQVDVGLGVEAGTTQIIDISDPNALLAGELIEFSCGIGLKGWWKLTGDANDTAQDNDGTLSGDAKFEDDVLKLDGDGDFVQIEGYKGIGGTQARSVCAWIKAEDPCSPADIISWGEEGEGTDGKRWLVFIDDEGNLRVAVKGGYIQAEQVPDLRDGAWHHIAAVWEKGPADDDPCNIKHARLYIDGQDPNEYFVTSQWVNTGNTKDVKIGILDDGLNRYFKGRISDVRIYDCALTDDYIRNLQIETKWSHRGKDQLVTFADDSDLGSKATFDGAGAYKLKLNAANSAGEQLGTDSVTIIVEDVEYVYAGEDKQIVLPTDRLALAGEIAGVVPHSVGWYSDNDEKVTFDVPFAEESMLASGAKFAEAGTYKLALVAKNRWGGSIGCDTLTVTVDSQAVNVEAGQDITIPNTTRVVNLGGSAFGGQLDFVSWEFGGQEVSFGEPCDVDTWAVFAVDAQGLVAAGDYRVALAAHNSSGSVIGADTLTITVTGEPEDPVYQPEVTVEAVSSPNEITWPDDTVTLGGEVTGGEGYQWFDSTGEVIFSNSADCETIARFPEPGTYKIELFVEAGGGAFLGADVVEVTVHEPDLTVCAGDDQTIILPDGAYLAGGTEGFLPDGAQVLWRCESDFVTIAKPDVLADTEHPEEGPKAIFDCEGMYVIELVVTYQDMVMGSDRLVITARQPEATVHIYDVEPDTTVSLPGAEVDVSAEVFAVGLNAESMYEFIPNITYEWVCSDPDPCAVNTDPPYDELHPHVTFTEKGQKSLRLNVYKTGPQLIGWDEVTIIVLPENQPPHVEAGSYPSIILEGGSCKLELDPNVTWSLDDGLPVSPGKLEYLWTKIEGPEVVTPDPCLLPTITFDEVGEYEFDLEASDGQYEAHDTLNIVVYPQDQPVHVYAGSDKTVTLPYSRPMDDAFAIIGQGMSLEWSVVDKPAGATVTFDPSASVQNPLVSFDTAAEDDPYLLQLAVKDDQAQIIDANQVQVWVFSSDTVDTTEPEITAFTATQGNVPIDPCVFGDVKVRAVAKDYDSGLASMELLLLHGSDSNSLLRIEDPCSENPANPTMQIEYVLHTYLWESGEYTLQVKATNGANPVLNAQKELQFKIADITQVTDAKAQITNIARQAYTDGQLTGSVPQVIGEGFFELEGIAYHNSENEVQYTVDLFRAPVIAYAESCWHGEPLESDYFVKNMLSGGEVGPGSGALGTLDFTSVPNGSYQLLLTVNVTGLDPVYASAGFILDCPLKIGNVRFSQEDVVISVGGVPLAVVRSYDSFNKDKDGEFGYGWSYSIANMDVELDEDRLWLNLEDSTEGRSIRWGSDFDRNVTLTLPDGRRTTFMFYLEYNSGNLYNGELPSYVAKYQAPPGVNATLETSQTEKYIGIPWTTLTGWNEIYSDLAGKIETYTYDFSGYKLTTEDGAKYYFERKNCYSGDNWLSVEYGGQKYLVQPRGPLYLSTIATPNGEKIVLNVDENTLQVGQAGDKGVEYYAAGASAASKAIKIDYDNNGRIWAIYAPSETGSEVPTVWYEYDVYGNLEKVHKLLEKDDPCEPSKEGSDYETITYFYEDPCEPVITPEKHYVTDIIDPRGLAPVRYLYDEDGVLVGVKDAKGKEIKLGHEIGQRNEVVEDRLGNVTIYTYNERGNVVRVRDAADNVTVNKYAEQSEHPDEVIATIIEQPDGPNSITSFDYLHRNDGSIRKQKVFDPENNVIETQYDKIGNVTKTTQYRLCDPCNADPCWPADFVKVAQSENIYVYENDEPTNLLDYSIVVTQFDDPCTTEDYEYRAERTEYKYNDNNKLEQVRKVNPYDPCDIWQVVSTYVYSADADPCLGSNSSDQPWSIEDAAGFTQYYYYDDNGNQIQTRYDWSDPADPCNPDTVSTITEYDSAGRVKKTYRSVDYSDENIDDYAVLLSETAYNSAGKVDYTVNQNGVLTKYEYDENGNLVETIVYESKSAYETWYWNYPASLNRILTVSRTLYDDEGKVRVSVSAHEPAQSAGGTENIYDELGRIEETKRWADIEIQMADITDAQGYLIGRKSTGWLHAYSEPNSYTRTEYDFAGRVKSTFVLDEAGIERETQYEYDLAGKQVRVIDPNMGVTETHYLGNLRDWVKDARGNVTYFDYDALGRLIKTTYPATAQNPVTYIYIKYDKRGRKAFESEQTAEIDPNDAVAKEFAYDAAGRLIKVILPEVEDPNNNNVPTRPVYRYVYDIYGNLTKIIDPYDRETTFTYNELHKQTSRTLPGGQAEYKDYDEYGRLILAEDFAGQITTFEYNQRGLLEYKNYYPDYSYYENYPDDPCSVVYYDYDNLGRKTGVILDGEQWYWYYDAEGKVIQIDTPQGTIAYEYWNKTGKVRYVRTPADGSGSEIEYTYDGLGRILDIIVHRRNGLAVNEWFSYGYNETGLAEWVCLPNGGCADYEYDELNRLVELVNTDEQSNVLSSFLYEYDDDGMRNKATETDELDTVTEIEWAYDNINRLTGEDFTDDSVPGDSYSHEYDLVGNRVSKTVNENVTTYSYNSNDQLTREISPTETIDYYYDLNGSLIQKDVAGGDVTDYFYNLQNRLSEIRLNDTLVAGYLYNPDGIRIEKYDGTETTSYLVDPYNLTGYPQTLKETTGSNARVYIIGSDILAQSDDSDDLESYLYDGHGSVRQLADADCTVSESYDYEAYGNAVGFNPASASTSLLYTGEPYDPESALYYLDARYYDPATIRLNRIDPFSGNILDPQSLHDYMYCHGNPANGLDPSGKIFISPAISRLIKAVGLVKAAKILIGIRATYVLGDAYIKEVGTPKEDVAINKQVGRIRDPGFSPSDWFQSFLLRPDIVDHRLMNVHEVKPDNRRAIIKGMNKVLEYIAALDTRYPERMYVPGTWQPRDTYYYIIGLPGISSIEPIRISAYNAGGGVIAYKIDEQRLRTVLATLMLAETARLVNKAIQAEMARARMMPGLVTMRTTLSRGLF